MADAVGTIIADRPRTEPYERFYAYGSQEGHFGLQGMRERVSRIGGKLTVTSSATSGTEITVVVAGGIVF